MKKQVLWRLGDDELPETCADFDALLAYRFADGVSEEELQLIEAMFVNLHGSSAWGRLYASLDWRTNTSYGQDGWYFGIGTLTGDDIRQASSVWVDVD